MCWRTPYNSTQCAFVCVLWICEDKMIRVFIWLLFVSVHIVRWAHWDISLAFHRTEWLTDSNIWIYLSWKIFISQRWQLKTKQKQNFEPRFHFESNTKRKMAVDCRRYIFIWRNHFALTTFTYWIAQAPFMIIIRDRLKYFEQIIPFNCWNYFDQLQYFDKFVPMNRESLNDALFLFKMFFSFHSFSAASRRTPAGITVDLFEQHQGTHILQVNCDTPWTFENIYEFRILFVSL